MAEKLYTIEVKIDPDALKGRVDGLYGRMPPDMQRRARKIRDAHNLDYAALELLDAFQIEWRE
jgi:hypothetical protein